MNTSLRHRDIGSAAAVTIRPLAILFTVALAAASVGAETPPAAPLAGNDLVLSPVQLRMNPLPGDAAFFLSKFGREDLTNDVPTHIEESDLNYAVRNWPLLPPDRSADQAYFDAEKEAVKEFIGVHRAGRFQTGLHPALMWDRDGNPANGVQPLLAPGFETARAALIQRPVLRVDEPSFLADNGIVEGTDSDGNAIYKFTRTDASNWYRFDDVQVSFFIQKEPSYPDKNVNNRYPDIEGTIQTDPAVLEKPEFLAKYQRFDAPYGGPSAPASFRLTDPASVTVLWGPPGDVAYDPGHQAFDPNDSRFEKEKMQIYVLSKATVMRSGGGADPVDAASFSEAGRMSEMGERKIYVEDHYPPMPSTAAELAQGIRAAGDGDLPASSADIDLRAMDPASQGDIALPRGFPDGSKGEGLLASLNVENDNPNDVNSTSTLNFEIGRSIRHRFRYSSNGLQVGEGGDMSVLDRYMIYVPPYKTPDADGTLVVNGPYVGNVDAANPNPEDPYATSTWLEKYTPIAFDAELLHTVNYLYESSSEKIQSEYGKTDRGTSQWGYPHTAKMVYKDGAECVIGLTAHGGDLKVPAGALSVPHGFASYQGEEYAASPDADLEQVNLDGKITSGNGGPNTGVDARDSYFKVNAADCCGNEKVIISGTFSTVDNVRPDVGVELEEAQTAPEREEKVRYVAAVPNDMAAGSNGTVEPYDVDSPHSRVDAARATTERGYGGNVNQAKEWDSETAPGVTNPADSRGLPFLDITAGGTKPPVLQNHRMTLTLWAVDNVGEVEKGAKVLYPIKHLSYTVFRPDGQVDVTRVVVDEDNNDSPKPLPPMITEPYIFRDHGTYRIVATARDLSGNERTMRLAVPVTAETPSFQQIETEQERSGD